MDKISRNPSLILVLFLALLALVACSSGDETPAPGGTVPGITVGISGSGCPGVEINLNEQVTWTNQDMVERPIRIEYPDGELMADLGALQPGDSASFIFSQAGTFSYTCSTDQVYTGTINVLP